MLSIADLFEEFGISREVLLAWLNQTFPRPPEDRGKTWRLSDEHVAAARKWRARMTAKRAAQTARRANGESGA